MLKVSRKEKISFLKSTEEDAENILNIIDDCIFTPLFQGSFGPI